jgi:ribosomal protein S18 acetylase RimI-like enzyme
MTEANASSIHVRPITSEDEESVIRLLAEFIRYEANLDPSKAPFVEDRVNNEDEAENYLAYSRGRTDEGGSLLVAEKAGKVVGLLCWAIDKDGPFVRDEFRTVGEVIFVAVAHEHRGGGIGRQLIDEATRLARDAGLNRLSLMVMAGNENAVNVYKKIGFQTRAHKMLKKI